jgi:hypothetical protein
MDGYLGDLITTKACQFGTWLAAVIGLGSALGYINIFAALASAFWICLQIYGYFKYTLPKMKAEVVATDCKSR